jgi:4-carboxymuconolactone decarboxylase
MRIRTLAASWCLTAILVAPASESIAQGTDQDLNLVGNRFRPLEYPELDAAQRKMVEDILAGPRDALRGPFNVLLRAPEMGNLAQALGAYVRFESSLPPTLREMAIIMTAAYWKSEFEWYAHKNAALSVGLDPAIVDAIAAGERPERMNREQTALHNLCAELLETRRVSDATFEEAMDALGERGVVDVIGTVGYYGLVSLALNLDEYPLPDGVEAQFE